MTRTVRAAALAAGMAGMTALPGCVGYRLGSTLPPDIKTIHVRLFENQCHEPLLEVEATNATLAEFQKDGTLRLRPADQADVILESVLTALTLTPLRYDRVDTAKPREYRMTLHVQFTLKRARTQQVINEGAVIGEATFLYAGNLAGAKRDAVRPASQDLAKRIVEKIVETW